MSGVYDGLTVVELADRRNQWAGKLLADGGARVIQIEPVPGEGLPIKGVYVSFALFYVSFAPDLRDLPPLLIQVGSEEVLLEDALGLGANARAAGGDVTVEEWPGMIHVWHWF